MGATASVTELDGLLDQLGRRGFLMHAFRVDRHGPAILGYVYDWGGQADVLIIRGEEEAVAYRTPTGPDIDVFDPPRVYWWYGHTAVWTLRALLTLAPPGDPDASGVLSDTPPGHGIPADRRSPVRVRQRGT